ncbi:DUF3427 domain-containing protein [Cesiribacter sp. SM1]|uniref:DUF3427 domain-containing protein n=1 Tax=Cesiribacter sp. SM1 TaxID=2861196 RepID=UPI001CD69F34|nr:DUF3427 domain-containing protein [Cesiribacter sp. SM1]
MFKIGATYTKKEIYHILNVPKELQRGAWDTGYRKYENDVFIFSNIGVAGRTGHDYDNYWNGDELVWYGKSQSRLNHQSIQELLYPSGNVYLFTRKGDRDPFVFEGCGVAKDFEDTRPVKITWSLRYNEQVNPVILAEELVTPDFYYEGACKLIKVNKYERNIAARRECLEFHGTSCKCCGFNFESVYGELGKDFIHVHHVKPLSEVKEEYIVDPIKDLIPLCPNCHAMVHRKVPALSVQELRERLSIH